MDNWSVKDDVSAEQLGMNCLQITLGFSLTRLEKGSCSSELHYLHHRACSAYKRKFTHNFLAGPVTCYSENTLKLLNRGTFA